MERTAWTDERLDDAFAQLREEMREFRAEIRGEIRELRRELHSELSQMKLFMLGSNVTILAGITIGEGSMIGAGAVVTRDVPDFAVVAGVPARVVGDARHR